jgi:hypothetical protein
MTQVNSPFLVRKLRPREAIDKLPRGDDFNNYLDQLERTLEQLYRRTGGTTDNIEDTDIGFSQPIDIEALIDEIGEAPERPFNEENYYSISASHTTSGDEFLQVSASCTVTLNTSPEDGEIVKVQPTGFFIVTISGSINGGSSLIMNGAYDLAVIVYSSEAQSWVVS